MSSLNIFLVYIYCQLFIVVDTLKKNFVAVIILMAYAAIIFTVLRHYIIIDFTVWIAILMVPYIAKPDTLKIGNRRYGWVSLIFVVLTFFTGVQTFYFLSIGFAMLYAIESLIGSIGALPFFLLGLISPTFKYLDNMLGFPVRLKLSELAGNIFQHLGYNVKVMGNVFQMNGSEFSVDPACVGLKMMAVSILVGILIMAYFQYQENKKFSFRSALIILSVIILLNILSNLFRILILSILCILPSNPAHDMVGLACFILYVIVPSYLIIKYFSNRWLVKKRDEHIFLGNIEKVTALNLLLLSTILISGYIKMNNKTESYNNLSPLTLTGYSKKIVNGNIIKLEKPGILLYIKPLQRFYGAEHNPMICWVGSGYEFSRINMQKVGNRKVFTGILKKETDVIYAAWWFDNGKYQTINQSDWRWRVFKGENFYLVNVNSGSEKKLWEEVKTLIRE